MKKLRWAMDGGFWELDVSTPVTLDGEARPVPGLANPLPLGLSRGTRLSRPKQVDFFRRFMSAPFVPSYSPASHGFSLQRVLSIPFTHNWFATLLGQFNLQKFVSSLKDSRAEQSSDSSLLRTLHKHLADKSLYALGFCTEILLTPDDTLLFSVDNYGDNKTPRKKAILQHKFPHHNLSVEAVWPGLFLHEPGNYWDVPFSMAIDLSSIASDSGASYHLCLLHNVGWPKQFEGDQSHGVPPAALLPGTCAKSAFSFKKNIEIWRSKAQKLKMVQPFDMFLSNPHISASGIIGAAVTACLGDNSIRSQVIDDSQSFKHFSLPAVKSSLLADIFSSVSFTAQYGSFQKLFLDLTRFQVCLDFPSGSKFFWGAARLAQDFFNSRQPSMDAIHAICPNATISLQQQIAGPFSFRVDCGVGIDWKNREWSVHAHDPVFAVEYALQVLGSAKAIAWYSPRHQEFMVELRFFEK